MATLPGLNKGVTKDPTPPATDTEISPITIPDGTTLVTTKTTNETIDNVDQLIDYVSGDNSPNFIPQLAIDNLVSDLSLKEDAINKGAVSGYAGLDASQLLLLSNFPSGTALQVLRRNAGNTALEFVDPAGEVFTWTADHSMATFKLTASAANDVILNAPTGQGVSIEVAGIQEYDFDATTADFGANTISNVTDIFVTKATIPTLELFGAFVQADGGVTSNLKFFGQDENSTKTEYARIEGINAENAISNQGGGLRIQILDTGSLTTYMQFRNGDVDDIDILKTLNINTNDLLNMKQLTFADDTAPDTTLASIYAQNTGNISINARATEEVFIRVGGNQEYNFSSTVANFLGNNIIGVGNLTLTAGGTLTIPASGATGFMDIGEITTPANPGANVGRLYVKDLSTVTTLFFRDSAGTETDLLAGGGEVFTWTADHSMATFKLTADAGNDVILNAPTGQSVDFQINSVSVLTMDNVELDLQNRNINLGGGTLNLLNSTQQILSDADDIILRVPTGDGISIEVNSVEEYNFDATQADFLGNDLVGMGNYTVQGGTPSTVGKIRFNDGNEIGWRNNADTNNHRIGFLTDVFTMKFDNVIEYTFNSSTFDVLGNAIDNVLSLTMDGATPGTLTMNGADFRLTFQSGGSLQIRDNIAAQFQFGSTLANWMDNDLINMGVLSFDDADTSIQQSGAELQYDVATGGLHRFRLNNLSIFSFSVGTLDVGDSYTIRYDGNSNRRIFNGTLGFIFEVEAGDNFSYEINSVEEYNFDATQLDMNVNHIMNLGQLELSDTSNLSGSQKGLWSVAASMRFNVPTGDNFEFKVNLVDQLVISVSDVNFTGNTLTALGVTSFTDTNTSIQQSGSDLQIDVATGGRHSLRINNTIEYDFAANALFMSGNDLNLGGGFVQFDDANTRIEQVGTTLEFNVDTGDSFVFDITEITEFSFDVLQGFVSFRRIQGNQGADIVGAATITLGNDGNYFDITGNTNIDFMTITDWQAGAIVTLQFDANSGVNDNTASPPVNTLPFALAGNFGASAGDTITVILDGAFWREISRSVN